MRPLYIYLISSIGIAACWVNTAHHAHGQLSQVLNDYKYDRPLQYAANDPWTRSKLFNRQTKHYGFGYNCDGEECKRESPYICWKNHTENDLPCKTGWWQRLNQTAAEIKQRIADGNCVKCAQCDPCQRCQQGKCGGCSDCQSLHDVAIATHEMESVSTEALVIPKPPYEVIDTSATKPKHPTGTITSLLSDPKLNQQVSAPVRTAGLESLNTRVK